MGSLPAIPPIPGLLGMDVWAVQVMGIAETIGATVSAHAACMRELRAKGVIR